MITALKLILALSLAACQASAQQPGLQDPLLEHLVGHWVLQGNIHGAETTHDVDAEWVLGHQYLRIHELSREVDPKGHPLYEAIVLLGKDQPPSEYACLWLDTTGGGGLSAKAMGHGKRSGETLPLLFKASDTETFHTTFAYSAATDAWQWLMDDEVGGKSTPFARLKLTRKGQ